MLQERGSSRTTRNLHTPQETNIFGKRPQTAKEHLEMRRAVYDRYKLKNSKTYEKVFKMLIAGQNNVYRALEREKELNFQLDDQNLVSCSKNYATVCRSKPVTYFAEKERKPITLDQILRDFYNKEQAGGVSKFLFFGGGLMDF